MTTCVRNCFEITWDVVDSLPVADPATVQSGLDRCWTEPWRDQLRFKSVSQYADND